MENMNPTAVLYGMVAHGLGTDPQIKPGRIPGEWLHDNGNRITLRYTHGEVWGMVFAPDWDQRPLFERQGDRFGQSVSSGADLPTVVEHAGRLLQTIRGFIESSVPVEIVEPESAPETAPPPRKGGLVQLLNESAVLANPDRRRGSRTRRTR